MQVAMYRVSDQLEDITSTLKKPENQVRQKDRCALNEGAGSPVELWRFRRRGLRGKFCRRHGSELSLPQERWRGEVLLLQALA